MKRTLQFSSALTMVVCFALTARGQFEEGNTLDIQKPPQAGPKRVDGGRIIISLGVKKDAVHGFSKSLGKWTVQRIDTKGKWAFVPVIGGDVGALQFGHLIYAYSGRTGTWDLLRLPEGKANRMTVENDLVSITQGEQLFTFAAATGKWSQPGDDAGENSGKTVQGSISLEYVNTRTLSIRISKTENAVYGYSKRLEKWTKQEIELTAKTDFSSLLGEEVFYFLIDRNVYAYSAQTGSWGVLRLPGANNITTYLERDAVRVQIQGQESQEIWYYRFAAATGKWSKPSRKPQRDETSFSNQDQEGVPALKNAYRQHEAAAATEVGLVRNLKGGRGAANERQVVSHQKQLRRHIANAFDARRQMQMAELARMRRRLANIEKTITARDRIKDKIIDRRVEDLLQPELRWQPQARVKPSEKQPVITTAAAQPTTAEIFFATPRKMYIDLTPDGLRKPSSTRIAPSRVSFATGKQHAVQLSRFPDFPGVALFATVELPIPDPNTQAFLTHNSVPIHLTEEDIKSAQAGNLVTKVFYLPSGKLNKGANIISNVETIASTKLDPSIDPIDKAHNQGYIVAILRMGNRSGRVGIALEKFVPISRVKPTRQVDFIEGAIVRTDKEKMLVEISIGSDDGIKRGQNLYIYRDKNLVAKCEVVKLNPNNQATVWVSHIFDRDWVMKGNRVQTLPPQLKDYEIIPKLESGVSEATGLDNGDSP